MKIEISNSVNYPIGIGTNEHIVFISVEEAEAFHKELGEKLSEYKEYRREMNRLPKSNNGLEHLLTAKDIK